MLDTVLRVIILMMLALALGLAIHHMVKESR